MPTLLEKRILNFIHAFIVKHGHSPTLVEIGTAMEISSKGTIHRYVQNLRNKGMLAQPERGWRGPSHWWVGLPLANLLKLYITKKKLI